MNGATIRCSLYIPLASQHKRAPQAYVKMAQKRAGVILDEASGSRNVEIWQEVCNVRKNAMPGLGKIRGDNILDTPAYLSDAKYPQRGSTILGVNRVLDLNLLEDYGRVKTCRIWRKQSHQPTASFLGSSGER